MHRLFVALDLPEDVRKAVYLVKEELHGFRWVPQEQLHLTLRFIGDSDDAMLGRIKEGMEKLSCPAFEISLNGIGHYPLRGLPRVLWVGIEAGPALFALQARVEQACVAAGVVPEGRAFSPHLTIARLKGSSPGVVRRFEADHAGFRCGPLQVSSFHLYSSSLTQQGAVHRRLASIPVS